MENETIIKPLKNITKKEYIKHIKRNHDNIHIQCKCGCDIFIVIGKIRNDNFLLLEEDINNHMNDIYGFRCPECKNRYRIMAYNMRILHEN